MKSYRRFRLFADSKLQTSLCLRVVCYWLICQATLAITVLAMLAFETSSASHAAGSPWRLLVPALITSAMVLPLVLLDLLAFSNKFAGPMVRFRRYLRDLNNDQVDYPINFRPGDYYQDVCDEFNRYRRKTSRPTDLESEEAQSGREREYVPSVKSEQAVLVED